mmetsp:Transcript_92645/g.198599  ORF Transcript_92645/g.198599 Transcript_92645/m.198599 type:complete len:1057 (+) Transcript_92645:92-3262(+)
MAIPWMPREVASRLYDRPHELENVKTTYLVSTAYVAGYLGREDGKRPMWFDRVRLMPATALTPDLQEHLANVCHVICMKARNAVNTEPATVSLAAADRPATSWQAGMLCSRVIWRAAFAAAAAKAPVAQNAVPVLFMSACESMKSASRKLLTQVWLEVQLQFTSKINKYRNMKSRPAWSVLEQLQYKVFAEGCGFGVKNPSTTEPSNKGTKPAANMQDYLEEVLALRFAIDFLSASMQDAQDYLEHSTRRIYKRSQPKPKVTHDKVAKQLQELKEKTVDSFAMMWTDDAELRGVASLAARLMDGLEGNCALHFAATFVGQMMMAMWKGLHPLFAHHATIGIQRIAETHSAIGMLPPPPLQDQDNDKSESAVFDRVAGSYAKPRPECEELVAALPRGVLGSIIKVQAVFRGFLFRARFFSRARTVAAYCKAARWPQLEPPLEGLDEEDIKEREKAAKKKKKTKKMDKGELDEQIADFQPTVSKYLGGDTKTMGATGQASMKGSQTLGSTAMSLKGTAEMSADKRAWPLPTADHRACADLFMLYMYNMYRRRELTRMWATLCGAYERGMDAYAELLKKNPALKPMLESIAAQLKRGSVVGYDKAFIAKQRKDDDPAIQGRIKPADAELFKRKPDSQRFGDSAAMDQTAMPKSDLGASANLTATMQTMNATAKSQKQDASSSVEVTGEYLTSYMKEMDGDDSQFKDISASVVPLSTGTSPKRSPPHEFILKEAMESAPQAAGGPGPSADDGAPKRPKLDVPFCLKRLKPIWLPIKAHRFAAYRAKVLQLLPQRVLQNYIDFEKQGQYAACIKLLESATPGSLNVLSPTTLVNGKPLLVETVLQLIVGYSGLCLKNQQGPVAVKLITQVIDTMTLSLRDLHPGHKTVLEAYLYDTALSVCYYMPADISLTDRAESFFQQASERYLRLGHVNRYCKCCLRAAAVLHAQGNRSEAEYYTQQALNKLSDAPVSSLLAVCYHNLAVLTMVQQRVADGVAHVRSYVALLRQLPKLGNSWMQLLDNTQWLVLKASELWPQYQQQAGMRDSQQLDNGAGSEWVQQKG